MRIFIACLALASADAEPDALPPVVIDVTPDPMTAADGVSAELRGTGKLAEARVLARGGSYHIELRDARGWTGIDLGIWPGDGTSYTLEELRWIDVVGDGDPELWVAISRYRDPCGCDDGPTFSSTDVIVCKASQRGPVCSAPIEVAQHDHVFEVEAFDATLDISRSGIGRLRIGSSEGIPRRALRAMERPRRLFR
jgi:hypothetical protein